MLVPAKARDASALARRTAPWPESEEWARSEPEAATERSEVLPPCSGPLPLLLPAAEADSLRLGNRGEDKKQPPGRTYRGGCFSGWFSSSWR